MQMSSFSSSEDDPAILKLAQWDRLPYNLRPSDLSEASLSPARKLLLLLSYQYEALLFPLTAGFPTSAPVTAQNPTEKVENPCEGSSGAFGSSAFISNVRSFAWGHFVDTYGHPEQSDFTEFLTVCTDNDIIFHAFRFPNGNSQVANCFKENGHFDGNWVEWGPSPDVHTEEQILHSHECEDHFGDIKFSKTILESKSWFCTFLKELDASWCGRKYLARFPTKSLYPESAAVLSFEISYPTLNFLESCNATHPLDDAKQDPETLVSALCNPLLSNNQASLQSRSGPIGSKYKCTSVFSGSLHNLLGLVLTSTDNVSVENELRNRGHVFVVVIMLYHWGMEWMCSINLEKPYHGPGPGSKWADFQFLDSLLVCLSTSGLTCIWCAKTGQPIVSFDVAGSCTVNASVLSRLNQLNTPKTVSSRSESTGSFKSFMVAPYSSLLAFTDDHNVIYVVDADDYITGHLHVRNKIMSLSADSDLAMLANWNVASKQIGCQKVFSDISNNRRLYASDSSKKGLTSDNQSTYFCPGKRVRKFIINNENYLDGYRSGSNILSHRKTELETLHLKEDAFSIPIRRVHLPPDHSINKETICFSPFGVTRLIRYNGTRGEKHCNFFHTDLRVSSIVDDRNSDKCRVQKGYYFKKDVFVGESVGFSFKGLLYVVTQEGLFVILPSIPFPCSTPSVESTRHWKPSITGCSTYEMNALLVVNYSIELWRPWQMEVFDRTLFYEGPDEAEAICLNNRWDLRVARLRRLQLGLSYLKVDAIKESLDMLVDANLSEEGILNLLFTSVYLLFCKVGNDNEVSLASRLLALASRFATKLIRKYGLIENKRDQFLSLRKDFRNSYIWQLQHIHKPCESSNSRRLSEMSLFLEVIRNLQSKLVSKDRRLLLDKTNGRAARNMADGETLPDDSTLPVAANELLSLSTLDSIASQAQKSSLPFNGIEDVATSSTKPSSQVNLNEICVSEADPNASKQLLPSENPKETITRWKVDGLDLKTVVQEALYSGRLPLAVLQLHLQRQGNQVDEKDDHDNFTEVCHIGRAIAYDLFLKGESTLAMETLLKLGEDVEVILRQLLLGTVRRSLRTQIAKEMEFYGYLTKHEGEILEKLSLIERLYPSNKFWSTYCGKQKESSSSSINLELSKIDLKFHVYDGFLIECGDIDGVVLGSWINSDDVPAHSAIGEEYAHTGYWACAAAWADAWDPRTIDRVVLDQPVNNGVAVSWESQLEFHLSHNNLEEIHKLFDTIPISLLSEETLKINLSHSVSNDGNDAKFPGYSLYICSSEELEPVGLIFPNIKVFRFSGVYMCSTWIKILLEQELARKFIFIKDYWESTAEFIPLLARAGLIFNASRISFSLQLSDSTLDLDDKKGNEQPHNYTPEALHKLILHYCTQYNLPYFLDLYLDHHDLVLDADTLCSLREVAGDCQWAKWLLCLRVKGCEYEASFFNARSNLSKQIAHASKLNALEVDEIIQTVDDMAEGGGELAALATLMYESAPLQKILCFGSVSRRCTSSSQCTLENLKPGLEKFPTLWRALVSACFGTDSLVPSKSSGKSAFSDYLKSRDSVFSSAGGDTSLLQMLPCWFPKSIRKLVRLFVQGSLGWQSHSSPLTCGASFLYRENNYILNAQIDGINPVSWEAALQKDVEELYSSLEEDGSGMEQHLHRGRALAAFNRLLSLRASNFKDAIEHQEPLRQPNIQSDVQAILSPLSQKEWSLLPSVIQLALMHFDDPVLVTSCTFLLELCGLSASVLRIDIAALQRISGYYTSIRQNSFCDVKPKDNAFHTESHEGDIAYSLARALADTYIHHENLMQLRHKEVHKVSRGKQLLQPLMIVLQHLEKASFPSLEEGKTCGYWLSSGIGDGFEFRSLQKDASRHWKLVTEFCQIHQLPLSTQYLALLANDNDWVGFLMEAQIGLFPADTVIKVAAKGFSNPQLKTHVLTVLKSMTSMRKKHISSLSTSSGSSDIVSLDDSDAMVPVELFGLIAMCEMQKNPGESLLVKAKDLRWSLLAMIASCFPDVSPLSCLTVWLEITAARETSSIKVNDISSKVAESVKAAVEATNALPPGCRSLSFHYNRRIPKRRRLLDPASDGSSSGSSDTVPRSMVSTKVSVSKDYVSNMLETCKILEESKVSTDPDEALTSLTNMVAVLCEQHLFLPLLRAFEMFLPSCSLLPFIRALQAFSQMRLSEAAVHLTSFSARVKDESLYMLTNIQRDGILKAGWISSTAVKAAEAMLLMCPSAYEKRCLLHLLAVTDFGDGGSTSTYFQRLHWKINLAEPLLRKDDESYLGNEILDDDSLLAALENNGRWDQARNWARQLESSGSSWKYAVHHVTETQAEAMVAEWKEFLWDVPEERAALWTHCHTLFVRYSFPAVQAGLFFLRHADAAENEIPARELHEMLLFALQWLSGYITQIHPVYPLYLLREIETRVWLLAVESEAQAKTENDYNRPSSIQNLVGGNSDGIIDQTATIIEKIDNHVNAKHSISERIGSRESFVQPSRLNLASDCTNPDTMSFNTKSKRRAKNYLALRRPTDMDNNNDFDNSPESPQNQRSNSEVSKCSPVQEENVKFDTSVSGWEEKVRPADMEKAVLSLLEFGQITAAKQLQHKLSPSHVPSELAIVDTALKVASLSSSSCDEGIRESMMDADVLSFIHSLNIPFSNHVNNSLKVLESLAAKCGEGSGRGLCWRIIAVLKAAKTLGLTFYEAFEIRPIELLQLLSLKAQDSLEEARLLVKTHFMPSASIARILADSFLKGLLAAHRGGYIDSQKDEGPAPLLWRFSDFLKWAELCPSEPEIGHALMRLVMTGQEIPHACEVELLILSHHFYKSSACLDGVDVLVTLAANRVESYVSEGDFSCLARLVTGVSNFHSLNFILNILIENDQLELLLNKYSTPDASSSSADYVRGFRMAVLSSLRLFNPSDLDSFAMAYSHFDMKHESASILESRALQHMHWWLSDRERDRQTEGLLEAMHHLIEAAEVYSTIDAGHKTRYACARAVLLSLQIRIPDLTWIELSETNARRALVEQSRFQEALIVAEAYGLNQPSEWAPVLWNQMLRPDWIEEFVEEFVLVLPLQPSMLLELARFYRSEVAARVDQNHFSVWLSPGGLPSEHLGKSFRILLRRTRDFRLRVQLATTATGFEDVIKNCGKVLDKVPDNAGPLILKRGHGGAYVPLM